MKGPIREGREFGGTVGVLSGSVCVEFELSEKNVEFGGFGTEKSMSCKSRSFSLTTEPWLFCPYPLQFPNSSAAADASTHIPETARFTTLRSTHSQVSKTPQARGIHMKSCSSSEAATR